MTDQNPDTSKGTTTTELVVPEQASDTGLNDEGGFFVTKADALVNWSRKNSLWPLPLGLSCCAIEFMATAASKYDMARFGAEVARFSPRTQPDDAALVARIEAVLSEEELPAGVSASVTGNAVLLGRSADGDLVVVMISEQQDGEALVAEVLQRIGWVRKHVSQGDERVRGIVLCEQAPESLSYTAAAVADTVAFKTWRVALRFEDLEL